MRMLICSIGSKQCQATLHFGTVVARALSADTTLLGMVKRRRMGMRLQRILEKTAQELADLEMPVQVRVAAGHAEDIIMAEMEQTTYDLVAMGALGSKRARHTLLDLVGMHIIERAPGSVLVIKGNRPSLSRVLISSSAAKYSRPAVCCGAEVACAAGAQVTVLHVLEALPVMYTGLKRIEETMSELLQTDTEQARELKWAAHMINDKCEAAKLKLRWGIVADEILREGHVGNHDLIVLGSSRSASSLTRMLMGDLTREVMSRAQRPVLVVRPVD